MATYYIDESGLDDPLRSGFVGQEWLTLSYACTRVTTPSDTIHINSGDYVDDSICNLSVGVNITGDSDDIPNITTNYVAGNSNYAYIRLYSSSLTNGNQTISYIHINGNNLSSDRCIWVGYRYNVSIHHCTIENFAALGVHFRNEIGWLTPPAIYATGNRFYDNTINNCASRSETSSALLRCDGQEDLEIYNNIFNQTQRSAGENGNILNISNTRDTRVYDNDFTKNDRDGSNWNFFSEIFEIKGGLEIYDNTYHGAATLDFGGWINTVIKGAYAFGTSIHDNTFESNDILSVGSHIQYGINMEAGLESVYIYDNYIKNYEVGIQLLTKSNIGDQLHKDIYVYNNRIEHVAVSDDQYTPIGIKVESISSSSYSNATDNLNICNNTITGGANYNYRGISCAVNGNWTNINIANNIISSFDNYAIYLFRQTYESTEAASIDGMRIHNNIFYNNGNDSISIDPNISVSNYTGTPNYTTDPGLLGISDFHLSADSTAIGAGSETYLLSETDYDNITWNIPPSIGAYEYVVEVTIPTVTTSSVTNIFTTSASCGGNVTHDGSAAVTAKGVCWNTSTDPTILNSHTHDGTGEGSFTSAITGLDASTHYYVRAYATNSVGTGYGSNVQFDSSQNVSDASIYYVATTGNDSYTKVQARNPATPWLTIQKGANEAIAGDTIIVKNGTYATSSEDWLVIIQTSGTVGNPITFISENKHGAVLDGGNTKGYGFLLYGGVDNIDIIDFEIKDILFSGIHVNHTNVTSNITISGCNIHHIGRVCDSEPYGRVGMYLSNTNNFIVEKCIIHDIGRYAAGESGCSPTNTYYKNHDHGIYVNGATNLTVRNNIFYNCNRGWGLHFYPGACSNIYVYNNTFDYGNMWDSAGAYGSHIIFDCNLTTCYIKNNIFARDYDYAIFRSSGTFSGVQIYNNLSHGGDGNLLYGSTSGITFSNNLIDTDPRMVDDASFDFMLQSDSSAIGMGVNVGLTNDYADVSWNDPPSIGAYEYEGEEPSTSIPTVTTSSVTHIFTTSASCGGNVTHDGSAAVTAKGVCWNTSTDPTILNSHTHDGTGEGSFTSAISGLDASTHYYVRAYATNSVGTGYGANVEFDSSQNITIPTVTTTVITDISTNTATGGGNVTHDGSTNVTIKGVCWSTSENPTVTDSYTNDGTGEGSYVSYLTGLNSSTHYHVRAYATNAVGTAYGIDVSFNTTYINIPDVSISKKMVISNGRYVISGSYFVVF